MMNLTLKPEFAGLIITRGRLTFDTINTTPDRYTGFYNYGFEDCFNVNQPTFSVKKYKNTTQIPPNEQKID